VNQPTLFKTGEAIIPRDRTCPKCKGPAVKVNGGYLCRNCGAILAEEIGELFKERDKKEPTP